MEVASQRALEPVPPFHPDLVLGVATYARELFEAAGRLDTVYVPVGMGSGINALIAVRDLLGLDTQIVGVVSENAPSTLLSFDRGEVVTTQAAATFVDGVATRSPDPVSIAGIVAGAARVIAVSDDATAEAMRIVYRTTHNVAESAGAIGLAGLLSESPAQRGERSAFVLCGGNVDSAQFHAVLGGARRHRELIDVCRSVSGQRDGEVVDGGVANRAGSRGQHEPAGRQLPAPAQRSITLFGLRRRQHRPADAQPDHLAQHLGLVALGDHVDRGAESSQLVDHDGARV